MAATPIGLDKVYYAKLLTDTVSGVAYEVPKPLKGGITANTNANASNVTLFADNGPYRAASTLGNIELELSVADLTAEQQGDLLGHEVVSGRIIRKGTDVPPWVAIGFRALKDDGSYRYIWLYKGKFAVPEMNHETKGDAVNFQPPMISGLFVAREYDGAWQTQIDSDDPDYVASVGTTWFDAVVGSSSDITAPTVTVSPVDGASSVATASTVVWTFNEAIQASLATSDNFLLIEQDGDVVAGTLSINSLHTVVTFTPSSALAALSSYTAIATTSVKNLANIALAAPSITNFTTA